MGALDGFAKAWQHVRAAEREDRIVIIAADASQVHNRDIRGHEESAALLHQRQRRIGQIRSMLD